MDGWLYTYLPELPKFDVCGPLSAQAMFLDHGTCAMNEDPAESCSLLRSLMRNTVYHLFMRYFHVNDANMLHAITIQLVRICRALKSTYWHCARLLSM